MNDATTTQRVSIQRLPSLRGRLVAWIVGPLALFIAIDTWGLYQIALDSANTAYDRTLLTSARSIGEQWRVQDGRVVVNVPFFALDLFETAVAGRMYYRVTGFKGEHLSGYEDFPPLRTVPRSRAFPALVHFYDDTFRDEQVRVAALWQPVVSQDVQGLALVMVAETIDSRRALTRRLLVSMMIRQALFAVFVAIALWWAVTRGLRPLDELRRQLEARDINETQLTTTSTRWRELAPLVSALNAAWSRLATLIESRKRFLVDASHQLRTPLAALKAHSELLARQSEHVGSHASVEAIKKTIDHATRLSGQLVSIARAEYGAAVMQRQPVDLIAVVREVGLELGADFVAKDVRIEFNFPAQMTAVAGDAAMLHELVANLIHNALRYTPAGGEVCVTLTASDRLVELRVDDSGPGVAADQLAKLGQRFFTAGGANSGSGLGLVIVKEIALAHRAQLLFGTSALGGFSASLKWMPESVC